MTAKYKYIVAALVLLVLTGLFYGKRDTKIIHIINTHKVFKQKPQNPQGIEILHTDKQVYDYITR